MIAIKENLFFVLVFLLIPVIIWSVIEPKGYLLWFAESSSVWFGLVVLFVSYKKYKLSNFSYLFIFLAFVLMLIGAHYSYSAVPFCNIIKKIFGFERNNFDKIGHFFQGFVATMIVKEIIYKKLDCINRFWVNFFSVSFAMMVSSLWEILEWFGAITMIYFGSQKPALQFMGAQGYVWDTQSDMFFAFCGALSIVALSKYHEKNIAKLRKMT